MSDAIEELFSDLDFYPGSRRRRRDQILAQPQGSAVTESSWEEKFVTKNVHGKEVQMYTIGALAQALNKSEKSIRLWVSRGYFPLAVYRMPDVEGSDGIRRAGRRLYTKEMIDAAVTSFQRRGLLDAQRIEWSQHRDLGPEIATEWNRIKDALASNSSP